MRVNYIKAARKPIACGKCREIIEAGQPYSWAKGRYTSKMVRCAKPECRFLRSDLTTSKMSSVYSAVEGLESFLSGWDGDLDDLRSEIETVTTEAESIADEYDEAAEAMGGAGEQQRERADELRDWGSNLSDVNFDDFEGDLDDEGKPLDAKAFADWKASVVSDVESTLGDCP